MLRLKKFPSLSRARNVLNRLQLLLGYVTGVGDSTDYLGRQQLLWILPCLQLVNRGHFETILMVVDRIRDVAYQFLHFGLLELVLNFKILTALWKLIFVNYILLSIFFLDSPQFVVGSI